MTADTTPRVLVVDRGRRLAHLMGEAWHEHEGPEIHHLVRTTRLLDVLAHHGPWHVLVLGESEQGAAGLRRLDQARALAPETRVLLAGESWRAVAPGTSVVPETSTALRAAVEEVLQTRPVMGHATGRLTAVIGVSGGAGRTTTAIALADLLAQSGVTATLVDLDLQFGKAAAALRRAPAHTLAELLFDERGRAQDDASVDEALAGLPRAVGEFALVAAPRDPVDADRVTGEHVTRLLERVREHAEHVVADTHAGLGDAALAALDAADDVVIVGTLDVPGMAALHELCALLDELGVPEARRHLVLNKELEDTGLPAAQAGAALGRRVAGVVPFDPAVVAAMNEGRPAARGDGPAAVAMRAALAALVPGGDTRPGVATGQERSLLGRWRTWLDGLARPRAVAHDALAGAQSHATV